MNDTTVVRDILDPPAKLYTPRNLVIIAPDLLSSEDAPRLERAIKELFELYLLKTRIKATENHQRLLVDDVQKDYSQDFVFLERQNKAIYNALRRWRHAGKPLTLVFIEACEDYNEVVDAWELTEALIDQIRNDAIPCRDLDTAPPKDKYYTTTSLVGRLEHSIEVMDRAQQQLDRINLKGLNPNLQRGFIATTAELRNTKVATGITVTQTATAK